MTNVKWLIALDMANVLMGNVFVPEDTLDQHASKVSNMATQVVEISNGVYKIKKLLPKNQPTQRKLLNFENCIDGEVSKSAKSPNLLTFKVNFLYQKLSESFSIFFSLKNINLGAHFCY